MQIAVAAHRVLNGGYEIPTPKVLPHTLPPVLHGNAPAAFCKVFGPVFEVDQGLLSQAHFAANDLGPGAAAFAHWSQMTYTP